MLMGKVTSIWFGAAPPAPFPSWWGWWLDASDRRVPLSVGGPISGVALAGVNLRAAESEEATQFVRSLAGIQTGETVQPKLVPGLNCTEMSKRQMYLDSDVILNRGPLTVPSFEERLDIL